MADTPTLELKIRDNAEDAVGGLLRLANSIAALKVSISGGIGLTKLAKQLETLNQKFTQAFGTKTTENVERVASAIEKISNVGNMKMPNLKELTQGASQVSGQLQAVSGEVATMARETQGGMADVIESTNAVSSSMKVAATETGTCAEKAKKAAKETKEHAKETIKLQGALGRLISPLDKVIHAFGRIMFYRMIRNILKHIGQGFTEGIKNVRAYSKAIDGTFNKAMTSAEDALLKMKNSLGAALAPALEALVPVLQTFVNWFITLVNYVNQFISLITGKDQWTRAIDASTSSLDDTKKAAKGAAKEVKNLLAGFDELNIIQSESGGHGGGTTTQTELDASKMFEQVTVFDEKLKNVVDWFKSNFDTVKRIAADIGLVIAGWKLGEAFGGQLADLKWLAVLGVLDLTFKVVTLLDNKFLETREQGYLVGNVLATMLGALYSKSLLEKVLKNPEYAKVGLALTFVVSAAADISAVVGNVDTSALSKESLELLLLAGAKAGAAGSVIAKMFVNAGKLGANTSLPMAFGGAALTTIGIGLGLKAIAQSLETEETAETLSAKAMASLALGSGIALIGKGVFGVSSGQAMLFGGGTALIGFAAAVGIKAVAEAVKSGFNAERLIEIAGDSLVLGGGVVLVGKTLGLSTGGALLAGLGVAGVLFSVAVGIKAVVEATNAGITRQTYIDTAIASLGTGVSAFGILSALGVTGGIAGVVAGGVAIATVAAVLGVIAILTTKRDDIHWGNRSLTDEQIKSFVNDEMFTVDVNAQVAQINALMDNAKINEDHIRRTVTSLLGTLDVLRLGVDTSGTVAEIYKIVFGDDGTGGLMKDVRTEIEQRKNEVKIGLTLLPYIDSQGTDVSSYLMKTGIEGWSQVEKYLNGLGEELNGYLIDPATKQLKKDLSNWEREMVAQLTGTIERISSAVAGAELNSSAMSGLGISLSEMDEPSARETIKAYSEYYKELYDGYVRLGYQNAANYAALAQSYTAMAEDAYAKGRDAEGEEFTKKAQEAADMANALYGSVLERAEDSANKAAETGRQAIASMIAKVFGDALGNPENALDILGDTRVKENMEAYTGYIKTQAEYLAKELENVFADITGFSKEKLAEMGLSIESLIPDSIKTGLLTKTAEQYGLDVADALAKEIGSKVPDEVRKAIIDAEAEAMRDAALSSEIDRVNAEHARIAAEREASELAYSKAARGVGYAEQTVEELLEENLFARTPPVSLPSQPFVPFDMELAKKAELEAAKNLTASSPILVNLDTTLEEAIMKKRAELVIASDALDEINKDIERTKEAEHHLSSWDYLFGKPQELQNRLYGGVNTLLYGKWTTGGLTAIAKEQEDEIQSITSDLEVLNRVQADLNDGVLDSTTPEDAARAYALLSGSVDETSQNYAELVKQLGELAGIVKEDEGEWKSLQQVWDEIVEEYFTVDPAEELIDYDADNDVEIYFLEMEDSAVEAGKSIEELTAEFEALNESMQLTDPIGRIEKALTEWYEKHFVLDPIEPPEVDPLDMSPVTEPLEKAKKTIYNDTSAIVRDISRLSGLSVDVIVSYTGTGSYRNGGIKQLKFAEGGFPTMGDMFIARESGPELVGRIGNRTAVANNDQIVQGVASGVASGQAEQNGLLRQQNDLLRQMLQKSGRVVAIPGADWGEFIDKSIKMYATNAGY